LRKEEGRFMGKRVEERGGRLATKGEGGGLSLAPKRKKGEKEEEDTSYFTV